MRAKALFLVLLASICGMIASIGVSSFFKTAAPVTVSGPKDRIYVALGDIPAGQRLTQDMIKLEAWYHDNVPADAVRHAIQLHDKYASQSIRPGEAIVVSKLAKSAVPTGGEHQEQWTQTNEDPDASASPSGVSLSAPAAEVRTEPEPTTLTNAAVTEFDPAPAEEPASELAAAEPAVEEPAVEEPSWVMDVYTPDHLKTLRWRRTDSAAVATRPESTVTPNSRRELSRSTALISGVGQPLAIGGTTLDGRKFDWDSYRGRPVVVAFWASWNAQAREELIQISRLCERYRDLGIAMIGVNVDGDRAMAIDTIRSLPLEAVHLSDMTARDVAIRYGVRQLPAVLIVDAEGRLAAITHRTSEFGSTLARQFPARADVPQISIRPTDNRR